MGNALRHVRGESQKNIVRFIEGLSGKYSRWDIWQDFIIMSAIAIANTMGGPQVKAREGIYRSRAEKYSTKELEVFADMLFEVVAELERDQEQDFLGELFMALGLGNEWKGQFFTPYDICRAMSAITYGPDMAARIEKQGWISVSDPACGAAIVWIRTPGGKSMPCDATPRYYIEKPRSGSKKIVTPNGDVISCEYTEDPHKATGTGFAPHWGSCRAAGSFKSREEHNG